MEALELLLSFGVTWVVILVPPALIRAVRRKPLVKKTAAWTCFFLYFAEVIFFEALGSQSKSHLAVLVGAFASYHVLRWQSTASARRAVAEQRRALGYDD